MVSDEWVELAVCWILLFILKIVFLILMWSYIVLHYEEETLNHHGLFLFAFLTLQATLPVITIHLLFNLAPNTHLECDQLHTYNLKHAINFSLFCSTVITNVIHNTFVSLLIPILRLFKNRLNLLITVSLRHKTWVKYASILFIVCY